MRFTFDTGMLIALERRKQRATEVFRNIIRRGSLPIVPAASTALRGGGIAYASDVRDLKRLQRHFPTVAVLPV